MAAHLELGPPLPDESPSDYAGRQRAFHAKFVDFDPDRMGLSPTLIRRRIRAQGVRPKDAVELAAVEEIVKVNEADCRLAVAISLGMVSDDEKERAQEMLDRRLNAAMAVLSAETREAVVGVMIPRFVDGPRIPHVYTYVVDIPPPTARRLPLPSSRRSLGRRRRSRASATRAGPGRRSDDDDLDERRLLREAA